MMTNSKRASLAYKAISAYQAASKSDNDDAPADLVCDILHYIRRRQGVTIDDIPAWLEARAAMNAIEVEQDSDA